MATALVSIALCTYNGAKYLREQLDTLVGQTYPNWEIIAVDDCSTDDTIEILNQYANTYPQIKIYRNSQNLGYTKNFEKAIALCTGAFIALCDQDDIWDKNKLSVMVSTLGDYALAYHDSAFVDGEGKPMNKRISDVRNCYTGNDSRVFLFDNCVLGHATLFKRELLQFMGNFNNLIIHDRWLGYVAANNGGIIFINEPLVNYRQHINANTNILKQERVNTSKNNSIEKMRFQVDVTTIFVDYPFNTDLPFKVKLLELLQDRMQSYTSFGLAYFMFKHRHILFYIRKKSAMSKLLMILKYIWGYKIKNLPVFIKES